MPDSTLRRRIAPLLRGRCDGEDGKGRPLFVEPERSSSHAAKNFASRGRLGKLKQPRFTACRKYTVVPRREDSGDTPNPDGYVSTEAIQVVIVAMEGCPPYT